MAFDFGKFAGALGQSMQQMGGGGGQAMSGGGGGMPMDMSAFAQLIPHQHIMDLLARYDQQQPQMQQMQPHQNFLTGGY